MRKVVKLSIGMVGGWAYHRARTEYLPEKKRAMFDDFRQRFPWKRAVDCCCVLLAPTCFQLSYSNLLQGEVGVGRGKAMGRLNTTYCGGVTSKTDDKVAAVFGFKLLSVELYDIVGYCIWCVSQYSSAVVVSKVISTSYDTSTRRRRSRPSSS